MVLAGDPLLQPVPRLQRWKPEEKCKWETAFTSNPLPVLRAGVLQSAPEVLSCGFTHCSHPAPRPRRPGRQPLLGSPPTQGSSLPSFHADLVFSVDG